MIRKFFNIVIVYIFCLSFFLYASEIAKTTAPTLYDKIANFVPDFFDKMEPIINHK
jgi:hypothetical protein